VKKGCLWRVASRPDSSENGGMDMTTLFTMALGLQAPWEVKDLQFNQEAQRLDISIDFTRGGDLPLPGLRHTQQNPRHRGKDLAAYGFLSAFRLPDSQGSPV
jgi:hypothetical protein